MLFSSERSSVMLMANTSNSQLFTDFRLGAHIAENEKKVGGNVTLSERGLSLYVRM